MTIGCYFYNRDLSKSYLPNTFVEVHKGDFKLSVPVRVKKVTLFKEFGLYQ